MCTVTIVPNGENDFILTSNRDEAPSRVSLPPVFYAINDTQVLFPKDELSGGTWVGISDKKRVVCLLNGGFVIHKRKEHYRLSRGVVVKDFMTSNHIVETIEAYNLNDIEPFTMVIADWGAALKIYELVWDGITKNFRQLPLEGKIWSSSTLYDEKMKKERLEWFNDFKSKNELDKASLLKFHKTAGNTNSNYGVVMNRGTVRTTSITQIQKQGEFVDMQYENLINEIETETNFIFSQAVNG